MDAAWNNFIFQVGSPSMAFLSAFIVVRGPQTVPLTNSVCVWALQFSR